MVFARRAWATVVDTDPSRTQTLQQWLLDANHFDGCTDWSWPIGDRRPTAHGQCRTFDPKEAVANGGFVASER